MADVFSLNLKIEELEDFLSELTLFSNALNNSNPDPTPAKTTAALTALHADGTLLLSRMRRTLDDNKASVQRDFQQLQNFVLGQQLHEG